ncbi:MAG: VRR-NUC domain-containing protein [Candidatus Nealsonbacteria bacterium]
MKIYSDFELRTEIKKLKKEKKYTEAKKLLLSRIDEKFFKKSGAYKDYCSQTFTTYFIEELIKLLIQLGEKEKALHVFKKGLKLPHLKRENEIAFSLSIQSIYPQIAKQYIPRYKIKTIERRVVFKKGKQKFLEKNRKELFVEEIALEYYRYNGNWRGVWLTPTTEVLYFKRLRQTIGLSNYKKLTSNAMDSMGHICNLCYGAPDLILYKGFIKKIGKSVEVKGLKDKLSTAQLVWIEQFNKLHLDFEVLQVKEKK